jgi:hypothetical protein
MNLAGRCESVVENLSECLFQRRLELRTYAANAIDRDTNANTQRRAGVRHPNRWYSK